MRRQSYASIFFPALVLTVLANQARPATFDFSYSGICNLCGPIIGNSTLPVDLYTQLGGVLTTTDTKVNGALTITGITGSETTNYYMGQYANPPITLVITGLVQPNPSQPYGVGNPDNLLYPSQDPVLDPNGFGFTLTCCNGISDVGQIAASGPGTYYLLLPNPLGGNRSFSLTETPEPKSLTMLGLAAIAALLSRNKLRRG